MRIMLVTPLFKSHSGGASVYFDLLGKGLAGKNSVEKVYVLSGYLKDESIIEKRQKIRVLRCLPYMNYQNRLLGSIKSIIIPIIILIFSKLLRIDLIHYHSLSSYKAIHYLSFFFRIPLICDMRDLAAKNEGASLAYYRHASKIICCSENVCQFIRSYNFLRNKTTYIPIPFKIPEKRTKNRLASLKKEYGLDTDCPNICFAGAIIEYKGIFELIDAFRLLLLKGHELRLVIIGPMGLGKRSKNFRKFKSEIRHPGIIYLGSLKREDALGLIQACDIFILPSKTESISRVSLEAISLGVKVILPGCVPEFTRYCPDFILEEIKPEKIVSKIIEVSNSDRRPTYPFSIHKCSKIIDQTYSLYMELILPKRSKGLIG